MEQTELWNELIRKFNQWIKFEKNVFLPNTEYFSPDAITYLTEDDIIKWAYKTRDELSAQRIDHVISLKNRAIDLMNYADKTLFPITDGLIKLCGSLVHEFRKESDAITKIIEYFETEPGYRRDKKLKEAYTMLRESEESIRRFIALFGEVFKQFKGKGYYLDNLEIEIA